MSAIARVKFSQYVVPPGPAKATHRTDVIESKNCELSLGVYGVTAVRGPHSTLFPWHHVIQVVFADEPPPPPPAPAQVVELKRKGRR